MLTKGAINFLSTSGVSSTVEPSSPIGFVAALERVDQPLSVDAMKLLRMAANELEELRRRVTVLERLLTQSPVKSSPYFSGDAARRLIVEALQSAGWMYSSQVADKVVGLKRSSVSYYIRRLCTEGVVEDDGMCKYRLKSERAEGS